MYDFVKYMEQVAINLKEIKHADGETTTRLHRVDGMGTLDEFLTSAAHLRDYNLIVVDNVDYSLKDNGHDTFNLKPFKSFAIVHPVDNNDYTAKHKVKMDCMAVLLKIISKMKKDRDQCINGMEELDLNSINTFTVGPIGDGFYGVGVNLTWQETPDICFTSADWETDFILQNSDEAWLPHQRETM